MSALAARRAAAAAVQPISAPAPAPTSNERQVSQPVPKKVGNQAQTSESESESIDQDDLTPLDRSTPKRRRLSRSPPARPRYFVKPPPPPVVQNKRKVKRFSPSRPVSESGDDSSIDGNEQAIRTVEEDVEDRRVNWGAMHTSDQQAGPSKR
jgi:hypothetical protein